MRLDHDRSESTVWRSGDHVLDGPDREGQHRQADEHRRDASEDGTRHASIIDHLYETQMRNVRPAWSAGGRLALARRPDHLDTIGMGPQTPSRNRIRGILY